MGSLPIRRGVDVFFCSPHDGYKDGSQVEDGFAGDLGAAVIVNGVISAGDLAKLYTWAQAGFGV